MVSTSCCYQNFEKKSTESLQQRHQPLGWTPSRAPEVQEFFFSFNYIISYTFNIHNCWSWCLEDMAFSIERNGSNGGNSLIKAHKCGWIFRCKLKNLHESKINNLWTEKHKPSLHIEFSLLLATKLETITPNQRIAHLQTAAPRKWPVSR